MTKFTFDDIVIVRSDRPLKPGRKAWIVGVFDEREGKKWLEKFPEGVVYSIEFEDGSSIEIHEADIELFE